MPGEVIDTAGLPGPNGGAPDPRKEAVKAVRSILRRGDATDDEWDSALEALIELSKD